MAALLALGITGVLNADVVVTKDGAQLVGKVTAVNGTAVVLSTAYAGSINVAQAEVVSIKTDEPLFYRLSGGTVVQGTVAPAANGDIVITGPDAAVTTKVTSVSATWTPGDRDPAIKALDRKWSYEANADITGKTGNSEQLGISIGLRAVLKGDVDTLQFYTGYNRQDTDGEKSADQFKAGFDYAMNFSGPWSWYVRDEGGFDRVKDIELYNIAASGIGYDFFKTDTHSLTGRTGLAFRYEGYRNPATEDVKSAGMDFGLSHMMQFKNSKMVNNLSYVPAFDDPANYRAVHDSYIEMPLTAALWKIRMGITNDYNSQPGAGVEKLDTTYYTRLVLNWE